MKKLFLFLFCLMIIKTKTYAAPGDTTWVQAHNDIWLNYYNNFDTTIKFPDGSKTYRKVYMIFTLGKYVCPGSPQWCSDWDYTIENFLMPKNGDTIELGRLISPYANTSNASTPASWKKRYIYDVTDYVSLLKDSATMRILYSGYSGGFTANVKFAFIEGIPMRNVLRVDNIYRGSHNYGDPNNSIENMLPAVSKTAPDGTQSAEMAFTVTGHGADNLGCSEFCSKYYQVLINNNIVLQKDIWRNTCGLNSLYPQSGTWIYDRGNWCPGDMVETFHHPLPGVSANNNFSVDVNFENYTKTGSGTPSYTVSAALIYYGAINRNVDADLLDVIAPNNFEGYTRQNNLCGNPTVKVRNNGKQPITSIRFEYGLTNDFLPQYTWNGTLNPMQDTVITLPEPWSLRVVSGTNTYYNFVAKIIGVNGQTDEDSTNNKIYTTFKPATKWPVKVIINMQTNTSANGSYSETNWRIYDLSGNVVAQRTQNAISTFYSDTLTLGPSCYKLVVEDDGCDGLYFWNNQSAGVGTFTVKKTTSPIPLSLPGYFNGDFGCGFTQYFTTDWTTDVPTVNNANEAVSIAAVPNPAKNTVNIQLSGTDIQNSTLQLIDLMGRIVLEEKCTSVHQQINTESLISGYYTVRFISAKGKLQTGLIIAK